MPAEALARADRHTRLRWIGIGLFCLAAPVLVAGVAAWVTGHGPGRLVPLCLFALGLSLGSFGSNDDSAVHAFAELDRLGAVPDRHAAEWASEKKQRPERVSSLHAHPRAALLLPMAATVVLAWAAWRVAGAWGVFV